MAERYRTGDPYRLMGKRIVFTSWHWVESQSGHDWRTEEDVSPPIMSGPAPDDPGIAWRSRRPTFGITLAVERAARSGPVISAERPWEGSGVSATILRDGGRYRAWANAGWHFDRHSPGNYRCYYESDDGYDWRRPELGLVELGGGNNILSVQGGWQLHPGGVFIDPEAPAAERYKWISEEHFTPDQFERYRALRPGDIDPKALRSFMAKYRPAGKAPPAEPFVVGARGGTSRDGIEWTQMETPLVVTHTDTHVVAYFDTVLKRYVGYFRDFYAGRRAESAAGDPPWSGWKRAIGRAETEDFRSFPLPSLVLLPDMSWSPNAQLYTNCRTTIPEAPDHHLMFPTVWDTGDDTTRIVVASSHDGRIWQYVPDGCVLETAPFGEWDGGCLFAYPELIELPNGDFALPYTGYNVPHKYPRGKAARAVAYALWPHGRIMRLGAKELGEFATVAFIPPGERMTVNAVVKRAGHLTVEACDATGRALPGRDFGSAVPVFGDCYRTPVVWKGTDTLGIRKDEPVVLRVRMNRASIYAFEFS